jgi:hypothetical protein
MMTPETQRSAIRPGALAADAARTGHRGTAVRPQHAGPQHAAPQHASPQHAPAQAGAHQSTAAASRAREDAGIVGVIPLLAVLVVTVAGVYIAWRQGSAGGGEGGVVAGVALLVAAVARLLLPAGLAGLLATRKRATDVATLAAFGAALVIAGLVLPR